MKIGIANDVAMAAEALRRAVASTSEHQVLWIARTGLEAVRMAADQRPDLILMDLNMPELDGVEATRQIMAKSPCAILIVTGQPQDSVNQVFRAMGAGALDVTATPAMRGGDAALLAKIKTIAKLLRVSGAEQPSRPQPAAGAPASAIGHLLAIGASTGGPVALATVLSGWQPPAGTAIVVVQHIDAHFTPQLARWLGDQLSVPVQVIADGDMLTPGTVQVAMTNDHLLLGPTGRLYYDANPREYAYRPSVDVFFRCVAQHWAGAATGVLLTGMGRDGAAGLLAMREAGKATISQDEASSAVYGMPRAAADLGAAQQILPLDGIARAFRSRIGSKL